MITSTTDPYNQDREGKPPDTNNEDIDPRLQGDSTQLHSH